MSEETPPPGEGRLVTAWGPALGVVIGAYVAVQMSLDGQDVATAVLDPMALGLSFIIMALIVTAPLWLICRALGVAAPDWIAPPVAAALVAGAYWDLRLGSGALFAVWGAWTGAGLTALGLGVIVLVLLAPLVLLGRWLWRRAKNHGPTP